MSLRILIADDEPLAIARLRALVEELGYEVCAEARDGKSTKQELLRTLPDVVLLDIEMPVLGGLAVAQWIEREKPGTPVILVTAHPEHAVTAFDSAVCDYVLKPVRPQRLARALDRAARTLHLPAPPPPLIAVRNGRIERTIPINKIDYFVADSGYVLARTEGWEGFVDTNLKELEARFGPYLLRIHRSCLAVKNSITGLQTESPAHHRVLLKHGSEPVPVSRRNLPTLKDFLHAGISESAH